MSSTEGLEDFVTIVDQGSITAAARVLGVPRSTLSRRLTALEEALGVRLLHRTTRSMTLSPAGHTLYRRARRIVEEARAVRQEVRRLDGVPRGLLRVTVPPGLGGSAFLGPAIDGFLCAYPDVQMEVVATARHLDLAEEGFDVGLRGGPLREDGVISRTIWRTDTLLLASPAYLDAHGVPERPAELSSHTCIVGFGGDHLPLRAWPLRDGARVPVQGRIASNDLVLQRHMALAGRGLSLLPQRLVQADIDAGRLIPVLPQAVGAPAALRVVYFERPFLDPKIRAFIDHITAWTDAHLPRR